MTSSGTATTTTTTSATAGTTAGTAEILADVPAAIARTKALLRKQIGDYAGVFAEVGSAMREEVAEIVAARDSGETVWPVVQRSDIVAGTVPADVADAVRRRGCAVVRNTFSREQAEEWDRELVRYVDDNHFEETYQRIDDGVFGGLAEGKPAIFPIYWSAPQMEARQHPNMQAVRQFLNSF